MEIKKRYLILVMFVFLFSFAIADTFFFSDANHNQNKIYNVSNITSTEYCNSTSCYTVTQFLAHTQDTNASTACSGTEALLGSGACTTPLFSFTESDPLWTANSSTVARVGNCPSGQFVQNSTNTGVQCAATAGSGDITSVQGDDIYIYNGSSSGDVNLVFNETKLNSSIDSRAVISETDPVYTTGNTTIARIGDCPAGEFVQNTTTGGVECNAPAGGGTVTSVATDDTYLTGGPITSTGTITFDTTLAGTSLAVNSSDYWDSFNTANATQFENNGGTLNIILSWFSSQFDSLFGAKDTDDLSEGSTNLYNNQSWNETHADTLYADISIDGTVTSVAAGNGLDFSTITSTGSVTMGTPSTLTGSTSNAVTSTSHTHSVTTDASGECGAGNICGGGHSHPASQITSGTFGTGNYVMDTNLTVEKLAFENSANNFIEDNSTCIKMHSATVDFVIC